jgi:hypothetical protein
LLRAKNSKNASVVKPGWREIKVAPICHADVALSSVIYVVEFGLALMFAKMLERLCWDLKFFKSE